MKERSGVLLNSEESILVVIDVQEKLLPAIDGRESLLTVIDTLLEAATLLNVPVAATEHCPDKIGGMLPHLRDRVDQEAVLPKAHFNAMEEPHFQSYFEMIGRKRPVICGVETHVCVLQTALGLKANGFDPVIVADAVGSRKAQDRAIALERSRDAGIPAVTCEMVIFEWLNRGDDDEFRQLLPAIKRLTAV